MPKAWSAPRPDWCHRLSGLLQGMRVHPGASARFLPDRNTFTTQARSCHRKPATAPPLACSRSPAPDLPAFGLILREAGACASALLRGPGWLASALARSCASPLGHLFNIIFITAASLAGSGQECAGCGPGLRKTSGACSPSVSRGWEALDMLNRLPRDPGDFESLLQSIGCSSWTPERIGEALGVSGRTVRRWRKSGQAPRMALLSVWWLSDAGHAVWDAELATRSRLALDVARVLWAEVGRLRRLGAGEDRGSGPALEGAAEVSSLTRSMRAGIRQTRHRSQA